MAGKGQRLVAGSAPDFEQAPRYFGALFENNIEFALAQLDKPREFPGGKHASHPSH